MDIHRVDVDGVAVQLKFPNDNLQLSAFRESYAACDAQPEIIIEAGHDGLKCSWFANNQKPLDFYIDVNKFTTRQKSFPAPKQGAFNQALGKRTKSIVDATAGWGGDALLMCAQGYSVTMLERNSIMALILTDAMQRLAHTEWAQQNDILVPQVIATDAIEFLAEENMVDIDCIYLDPMFPSKRKKSAASNKHMQFLQWMLGADSDAGRLAVIGIESAAKRVVVKRPDYALPLVAQPSSQFSSKLVHYDVYLKN